MTLYGKGKGGKRARCAYAAEGGVYRMRGEHCADSYFCGADVETGGRCGVDTDC